MAPDAGQIISDRNRAIGTNIKPGDRMVEDIRRPSLSGLLAIAGALATLICAGSAQAAGLHPSQSAPSIPTYPARADAPAGTDLTAQRAAAQHKFESDPNAVKAVLDNLIREATERNPDLIASSEETRAAVAHVPIAGSPEDPQLGFRLKDMPTTFSFTRENATEKQILFSQKYPFPGKLGLRQEVAGRSADVIRQRYYEARIHLVTQVRSAFADVFVVDKEIELALEHERMLKSLVAIATDKYRIGPGLQEDVLNAHVAVARVHSLLIELARKRASREISLATLLDDDSIRVPSLGALPPAALAHSAAELEEMALASNPAVRERMRAIERDQTELTLAKRSALPDFSFAADYGSRNDHPPPAPVTSLNRPDLIGLEIKATVPVFYFTKQRQEVAEAQARLARSKAQLSAMRRATVESLRDLLERLHQHEQVAESFRDEVIPLARSAVAAAVSAYQVDKVDFLTMLAAQDNLDNYRAEYWNNEAARFNDLARIDEVTGGLLLDSRWNR
jgi:outer membrane protein, heavy metal efflux system